MAPRRQQARKETVACACCYCGSKQAVETPPSLHTCSSCGHSFRTYLAPSGTHVMELSDEAKKRFLPPPAPTVGSSAMDKAILARIEHLRSKEPS